VYNTQQRPAFFLMFELVRIRGSSAIRFPFRGDAMKQNSVRADVKKHITGFDQVLAVLETAAGAAGKCTRPLDQALLQGIGTSALPRADTPQPRIMVECGAPGRILSAQQPTSHAGPEQIADCIDGAAENFPKINEIAYAA